MYIQNIRFRDIRGEAEIIGLRLFIYPRAGIFKSCEEGDGIWEDLLSFDTHRQLDINMLNNNY